MVDRVGFRVEGLTAVVRELRALGLETADLKEAFARIAQRGADRASQLVPRRTGRLASTIRGNRATSKAVVAVGRATVPYAGPINYGWAARNIAPAHYLQRTDEQMQPIALQMLEDEINHQIRARGLHR